MGTETKFNCYVENTSNGSGIPKLIKDTSSDSSSSTSSSCASSPSKTCNGSSAHNSSIKELNGSSHGETTNFFNIHKHAVVINGDTKHQEKSSNINTISNSNTATNSTNSISNSCSAETPEVATPVPFVPIHIDENDVVTGAKEILKVIRPHWNLNDVQFKKFTDGITNKLVGCFNTASNTNSKITNGKSSNGNSNHTTATTTTNGSHEDDDNNDDAVTDNLSDTDLATESSATTNSSAEPSDNVVLVRVYGNKTDLLIDRKAETRNILLLHSYGFAPSLYATFKNGLAYDYVPGVTLNTKNVLQPEVWRLVACRMAEMHRMVKVCTDNGPPVPMLWKKTQSFLNLVPERFSNADKHKRLEEIFLPISRMRTEFEALYKHLEALDSPLVFAHNDLLLGNVVYTESRKSVTFIDYEYADYNFQAYDLGNHFDEFAGVDEVDFALYPKREFQLEWLRVYLQTYLQRAEVSDAEVERLYVQVNQFSLAAHILWTIWSLIQAEHSTIDFDYAGYAVLRYNEYLAKKDELLALDINVCNNS